MTSYKLRLQAKEATSLLNHQPKPKRFGYT